MSDGLDKILYQSIGDIVAQDEAPNLASDFAAIGAIQQNAANGMGLRQQLMQSSQENQTKLGQSKLKILDAISTGRELSKSETAAMLLISLLPIAAGGLLKGKKGIAKGAEAAALGTTVMKQGFDTEEKRFQDNAKLQLQNIQDEQLAERKFQRDATLAEASAQDEARENSLDRASSATNAAIRAGGDAAVGKGLLTLSRQMDVNRKSAEEAARLEPVRVGDKIYMSSGSVTDQDRTEIRKITPDLKTATRNLDKLYTLSKNLDLPALERLWSDNNSELFKRRAQLVNSLQRIYDVDKASEAQLKRVEQMVTDPQSWYDNIISQAPGKTGIPSALETDKQLLSERIHDILTSRGASRSVRIGESRQIKGKEYYAIGLDPQGNAILTADKDKLMSILEQMAAE